MALFVVQGLVTVILVVPRAVIALLIVAKDLFLYYLIRWILSFSMREYRYSLSLISLQKSFLVAEYCNRLNSLTTEKQTTKFRLQIFKKF